MPINSFLLPGAKFIPSYEVANSSRWDNASSMKMTRTPSGDGNLDRWTWSFWIKLGKIGTEYVVFHTYGAVGTTETFVKILSGSAIEFSLRVSGTYEGRLITNRLLKDPSAWMHLCFVMDTPNSTSGNRMIIYVNGVRETSFSTETYPDQNQDSTINDASFEHTIGSYGSGNYFDGYMAEVVLLDGTAAAVTDFGEFDEDSPTIWKPKDVSGLTFGTNGFYLDFKDSSNLGNDANGGQDWTEVNFDATDQATDTCTNNFCTMNSVDTNSSFTISEGNCKLAWSAAGTNFGVTKATMGVSAGKWYWEVKYTYGNAGQFGFFDVNDIDTTNSTDIFSAAGNSTFEGLAWRIDTSNNIKECANGQTDDTNVDFSSGNILGIAFDADNGKIYAYQNGTEITNQNIGAGTSLMTALTVSDFYLPFISNGDGGSGTKTGTSEVNFGGCPAFSISSGNSDANGYGNFEYSVPSGYYSLCTKNLAEFG